MPVRDSELTLNGLINYIKLMAYFNEAARINPRLLSSNPTRRVRVLPD